MARSGMQRGAEGCRRVQRSRSRAGRPVESPTRSPLPARTPGPLLPRPIPGAAEHPMQQLCRNFPAGLLLLCKDACPPAAASGRNSRPSNKPRLRLIRPALTSTFPSIYPSERPTRTFMRLALPGQPSRSWLTTPFRDGTPASLSPPPTNSANKKILLPTVGEEDFSKDIGRGSRRESVDVRISEPAACSRGRTSDLPRGCRTRADPYRPESGDRKSRSPSGSPAGRPSPGWLPR